MRDVSRRTFLLYTGRWLILAGLAPAVSGCGRALRWSDSQGRTVEDAPAGETSTTAAAAPETTTTSTKPVGSTTSSSGAPATTTTGPSFPDLAVFRGDSPDQNVRAAVAQLGGMERFVKRDAKVVVKPNVLTGRPPEYATTTNPLVISAIIRMCFEAGAANVTVLDYPTSSPRGAFEESGLAQATKEAGGTLKYLSNRDFERIEIPEGVSIDSWPLVTAALEADTFINVPIGKTHGMAGLTLAMKNLMGIMGDPRGKIHIDYARKITDVNTVVRPDLVILDAYRVLMRNGPTGGNLDDVAMPKTVVAGTSQVAVDAYGATIMGWQPAGLASLVEANARGLGEIDLSKYAIFEGAA
ncbi:MAG: DUF362 domain-containing protein [Thermoleophilia bacterium]|nr:DUF362 domain-containing protein [Thermoleophilia bacterium]